MNDYGDLQQKNRRLVLRLGIVVLGMFAFGYALVPLYDVFCDLTGLNGKTGRIEASEVTADMAAEQRHVTVEFVANVNGNLPWEFRPSVAQATVTVGELSEATFVASNFSRDAVTGRAVPSVAPGIAGKYFNKTECFCFTNQTLAAGEEAQMPVRFIIDPKLPVHIKTLTLSYTFFEAQPTAAVGRAGG